MLFYFLITLTPFLALSIFSLMWWFKFNFSSKLIPKYFWIKNLLAQILFLKKSGKSRLKTFSRKQYLLGFFQDGRIKRHYPNIFFESLFKWTMYTSTSQKQKCIICKKFSCWRNNFMISYVHKTEKGPKMELSDTPAYAGSHEVIIYLKIPFKICSAKNF